MTPRPFTVVAGFLGAGKTTLVNRILAEADGTRFAILVNDFGSVNVDADLIAAHDGQTLALTNGCICCAMSDGFIQAMLGLMAAPERFDHVIVEGSGVAVPSRIMDFARLDPLLTPDAILTLADAETLDARLGDPLIASVVAEQIRQADIIVLNRTDLADGPGAEAHLARLNPAAPVLRAVHAAVPLAALLGHGGTGAPTGTKAPDVRFHTRTLRAAKPLLADDFTRWSKALPRGILRGKGRVSLHGAPAQLWQRVGARATLTPLGNGQAGSEIVLIASRPLDRLDPGPFDG